MNTKERRKIALFRYGILAPLISGTNEDDQSIKDFFRNAADKVYTNPRGEDVRVAASTLSRWYYNYTRNGFDALMPVKRWDTGRQRKLDNDIRAQIKYLKQEYPRIPATLIHQKLMDNGTIEKGDVSLSTVTRYVNQLNTEMKYTPNKDMRRYERAHINEVWCGDSCAGPSLFKGGRKKEACVYHCSD